jgi:hypothetical protein
MRMRFLMAVAVLALSAAMCTAGGLPRMYVVVEKVVVAPCEKSPQSIQIYGWFTRAQSTRSDDFSKPTYGYIHLGEGCDADLAHWKKAAGTGKVVVVGCCGVAADFLQVPIHKVTEPATKPDAAYPKGQLMAYGDLFADRYRLDQPAAKALLAAAEVKPADGATMTRFITDAVFLGLERDGVPRAVAAQLAKNPDFLGKCSLCNPTHDAFVRYSQRSDQPEGKGLKEDLQVRLSSTELKVRHEALRELVQGYMERAYAGSKLTDEERAALRAAIDKHRKVGEGGLPRGQTFCPSCDGAACALPR